ncbi:hypothetical protein HYW43_01670 [Candidatus Daviesbacteria bacterium]|nr:hypothetical protein [Candidatus Daviesbacteria bacterium]
MKSERTPQCLLGNGECSPDCQLFQNSKEITDALGDDFDPQESRRRIVFADAFNHNINATHIAAVMSMCAKEGKPESGNRNQHNPKPTPQRSTQL